MFNFAVSFCEPLRALAHSHFLDHDVEQFEDDPLEFIRSDLSLPTTTTGMASFSASGGGDATTRRQAAANLVRALVSSGYEAQVTEIVYTWVNLGLQVCLVSSCHIHAKKKIGVCQKSSRELEVQKFCYLSSQRRSCSWYDNSSK